MCDAREKLSCIYIHIFTHTHTYKPDALLKINYILLINCYNSEQKEEKFIFTEMVKTRAFFKNILTKFITPRRLQTSCEIRLSINK